MHATYMWLTDAATVVVGADWTLHPWRYNNVGGVTAGQARHNSSNVGGVTAGQVGHNSSSNNNSTTYCVQWENSKTGENTWPNIFDKYAVCY